MRCDKCHAERSPEDFYFGNTKCYRCVFYEKLEKSPRKKKKCRICDEIILGTSRTVYCSEECAEIGLNYMTRISWNKRLKMEREQVAPWLLI